MNEADFWRIIEHRHEWKLLNPAITTYAKGYGEGTGWKEDIFVQNLALLEPTEILSFDEYFEFHIARAERDDLFAAADLIFCGLSDDFVMDVIKPGAVLLGQSLFESVIRNPDETLASLPKGGDELASGQFRGVGGKAYRLRTGKSEVPHFEIAIPSRADPPSRCQFELDFEEYPRVFPKLWERWKHQYKK